LVPGFCAGIDSSPFLIFPAKPGLTRLQTSVSAWFVAKPDDFLARHPKVQVHFTPTYSSWLNQIELWFSKIERDVIARGVFTSVPDLRRKLMKYIRHYNNAPKTVK
jgi:hypothetical protein